MRLERRLLTQIFRPKESILPSNVAISASLGAEIEQCLSYFERTESETRDRVIKAAIQEAASNGEPPPVIPEILKGQVRLKGIHGRKYTVGRLEKGYFWEAGDNVRHAIGNKAIPSDIIDEIQTITLPYAEFTGRLPARNKMERK